MPRFSANISMLFQEVEFPERFDAAAQAGFKAVEIQFPYGWSKSQLGEIAQHAGVEVVLINIPAGDPDKGDRGIGCLPGRVAEFREGVAKAIEYAGALGCKQMNCLAGVAPPDRSKVRETYVSNLRYTAGELALHGMTLLIEPINTQTVPGFYLNKSAQAFAIIDEAGASPEPERSIFLFCSISSTASATRAGSARNTFPREKPRTAWRGRGNTCK